MRGFVIRSTVLNARIVSRADIHLSECLYCSEPE
jgi:hypothetical protein